MRDWLMSLKIRVKLLAAFGSILLLSVFLIFFSISSINTILEHKEINERVDLLKLYFESLSLHAKDFMYEEYKSKDFLENKRSLSIERFNANYESSKVIVDKISKSTFIQDKRSRNSLADFRITLDSIQKEFKTLVDLLQSRGFKDFGLEGNLRTAIHQIENSGFSYDKASMLTLRRHEKDFFLRKDLKYQKEFNDQLERFREQLAYDSDLATLEGYLNNYQEEFNAVVNIEKKIGLTVDEGIRGRIKRYFTHVRPQLDTFRMKVKEKNEAQIFQIKIILGILFTIQIIAGLIMALVYANLLTKSIKEIRSGMQRLASGVFPEKLTVRSTEEIGQTKDAFNQFVDRLKAATSFAEQIGTASQRTDYDARFSNDVLAVALISTQKKLIESDERQRKTNWANQGVAAFNDILKNENDHIDSLSDKILKLLIRYLHANQGAIYLIVNSASAPYLKRVATYAYDKKKFETHKIAVGDGLVGQCVLEGTTTYLKDIPKDFVKISSGLGGATPRNVLITPLKVRTTVMGVVELASFTHFELYQIEFIERVAENIAIILADKQKAEETAILLEEAQRRSAALARQEEEMRKSTEALQAMQEEMDRRRSVLQAEIEVLKQKLKRTEIAVAV